MDSTSTNGSARSKSPPRLHPALLERLAVCALLLLAFVPRARDLNTSFDRGFEGFQGSFFAIAAINYERLGVGTSGGYPVVAIDPAESSERWFVYANHSPLTSLLAWGSLRLFGPEGWSNTWEQAHAPDAVEAAIRLPFLLFHMAGLLALWWLARLAFGRQVGLLCLALVALLPVSAMYGTLVNYENPSLPFALGAVAAYGAYVRGGHWRALTCMGLCFLGGCAFTFGPLFFLPFLCLRSLWTQRWRECLLVGVVGGLACAVPFFVHDALARRALDGLGQTRLGILQRAQELLGPLLSGELGFGRWCQLQVQHAQRAQGTLLVAVAAIGLLLSILRALSTRLEDRLSQLEWPPRKEINVDLATPLLAGGLLYLVAFYRHTAEEQWSFQLYLVPGVALLAARAVNAIGLPLQRLRGGIAPLVLVTGSLMLPGLASFESWRRAERAPGPRDPGGAVGGPEAPLPQTVGLQLAEILPAGSVGFHPSCLGLTPASAWYAWRSLFPITSLEDPAMRIVVEQLGLGSSPRFLLLPEDPPPAAREEVERLRAAMGPPDLRTGAWAAWEL